MRRRRRNVLWVLAVVPFVLLAVWLAHLYYSVPQPPPYQPEPLDVAVCDPLKRQLSDPCSLRHMDRDYTPLANVLAERLGRSVELHYASVANGDLRIDWTRADLLIGLPSDITPLAETAGQTIRPILHLTDNEGRRERFGTFVARRRDPARTIADFTDHLILFGPSEQEQRHAVALAALADRGVAPVPPLKVVEDPCTALHAVARGQADVAVISSHALRLLERFGGPNEGALRVVGRTAPLPPTTVYATTAVRPSVEQTIVAALLAVEEGSPALAALDSQGFVKPGVKRVEAESAPAAPEVAALPWTDWRGPGRTGISRYVPVRLPARAKFLWKRGLTGPGLSGVAATGTHVIVADKTEQNDQDIWRCLDANTGRELWTIAYATPEQMQFTNAPRATPVVHGGFVYLLGAFGDLHCIAMHSHQIIWRRNLVEDFAAKLPPWGLCSTPLVVGDLLIVNPGAEEASLVALGLYTGDVAWQTPGGAAAPASLILGTFGGVRQIVGYDAESLGGWDPNTGERLWSLRPTQRGDYNVATPVQVDRWLLVATHNNGTRLYDFDDRGRIRPEPIAQNLELAPDMSTPVTLDGLVFGCAAGLHCLDLGDHLRQRYAAEPETTFRDYATLIAGNGHVLAATISGELVLLRASRESFQPVSRLRLFEGTELWSHPALVGNRLYLRTMNEVACLLLDE